MAMENLCFPLAVLRKMYRIQSSIGSQGACATYFISEHHLYYWSRILKLLAYQKIMRNLKFLDNLVSGFLVSCSGTKFLDCCPEFFAWFQYSALGDITAK